MSQTGQLIVLKDKKPEDEEIILLKDVYENKSLGRFTEIAVVGRRNFLGLEGNRAQRDIMRKHVNDKLGYMKDFILKASILVRELILKNGLFLYIFLIPQDIPDMSLIAVNCNPSQPTDVRAFGINPSQETTSQFLQRILHTRSGSASMPTNEVLVTLAPSAGHNSPATAIANLTPIPPMGSQLMGSPMLSSLLTVQPAGSQATHLTNTIRVRTSPVTTVVSTRSNLQPTGLRRCISYSALPHAIRSEGLPVTTTIQSVLRTSETGHTMIYTAVTCCSGTSLMRTAVCSAMTPSVTTSSRYSAASLCEAIASSVTSVLNAVTSTYVTASGLTCLTSADSNLNVMRCITSSSPSIQGCITSPRSLPSERAITFSAGQTKISRIAPKPMPQQQGETAIATSAPSDSFLASQKPLLTAALGKIGSITNSGHLQPTNQPESKKSATSTICQATLEELTSIFQSSPKDDIFKKPTKPAPRAVRTGTRAKVTNGSQKAKTTMLKKRNEVQTVQPAQAKETCEEKVEEPLPPDVDLMFNSSATGIEEFLSNGQGQFHSDSFINDMFEAVRKESTASKATWMAAQTNIKPKVAVSNAVKKVAEASESLMSHYKRLNDERKNRTILEPESDYSMRAEFTAVQPRARPRSTSQKRSVADLDTSLGRNSNPIYVDGTHDSNSDESISSSILESQDPTQPPTPPVFVSSGESSDRSVVVVDDEEGQSSSQPVTQSEADHGETTTEAYSDHDSSTLSADTNGTFDSGNQSPENSYAVAVQPSSQSPPKHNATCNIDFNALFSDLSEDMSFEDFKRRIFATSSPKPKPAQRTPLLPGTSDPFSDDKETRAKRQHLAEMFGPVNNPFHPEGWIKTRCREDYSDDNEELMSNQNDVMWGSAAHEVISGSENNDDLNVSTSSNESTTVTDLIAQDGKVTDEQEIVTRRNIKKAAINAFAGNALFYGDTMEIPMLLRMALQQLFLNGNIPSYYNRMIRNPFVDDTVPELSMNAKILLKGYKQCIDREVKLLLEELNVKLEILNESRVKRFYNNVVNAIVTIIPDRHILYDHVAKVAVRNKQVDTGPWSKHDFGCFIKLLEGLKLRAKDAVVNEDAFWKFFASELRDRSGVSRTPEECSKLEETIIKRFHQIKGDKRKVGRDKLIFDTIKKYPHVYPSALGSSTVQATNNDKQVVTLERAGDVITVVKKTAAGEVTSVKRTRMLRDKNGKFASSQPDEPAAKKQRRARTVTQSRPPVASDEGNSEAVGADMWRSLNCYEQGAEPRTKQGNLHKAVTILTKNSTQMTTSVCSLLGKFESVMPTPQGSQSSQTSVLRPFTASPERPEHECDSTCNPFYCYKLYED